MNIISATNACTSNVWESEEEMTHSKPACTVEWDPLKKTDRQTQKEEKKGISVSDVRIQLSERAGLAWERPWFSFLAHSDQDLKKNSAGKKTLVF